MAKRRRGLARRILRGLLLACAAWAAVTVAAVVALRWIDPPCTHLHAGEPGRAAFSSRDKATSSATTGATGSSISKHAAIAVIAAEDQQFPKHRGFDFKQIDKALADRERGRRVRGASTISQQVAKNLFLWQGQSWFRKGLEAGITRAHRGLLEQAAHPRGLPEHRRVRPRHLRRAGGQPAFLPQGCRATDAPRSRVAGRRAAGADAASRSQAPSRYVNAGRRGSSGRWTRSAARPIWRAAVIAASCPAGCDGRAGESSLQNTQARAHRDHRRRALGALHGHASSSRPACTTS